MFKNLQAAPAILGAWNPITERFGARQGCTLCAKAKESSVREVATGTFAISGPGSARGAQIPPILIAPEIAGLGVAHGVKAEDGSPVVRSLDQVWSGCGQRVIDGAPVADTVAPTGREIEGLRW